MNDSDVSLIPWGSEMAERDIVNDRPSSDCIPGIRGPRLSSDLVAGRARCKCGASGRE